jgi:hypothetical protein
MATKLGITCPKIVGNKREASKIIKAFSESSYVPASLTPLQIILPTREPRTNLPGSQGHTTTRQTLLLVALSGLGGCRMGGNRCVVLQ